MNTREERAQAFERLRQDMAKISQVLTGEGLHALPGILDQAVKTLTEIEGADIAIAEDEVAMAEEKVDRATAVFREACKDLNPSFEQGERDRQKAATALRSAQVALRSAQDHLLLIQKISPKIAG